MAKDQKGHGSNKRGVKVWGTGKKADPNRQTILVHRDEKGYITAHTENGKPVSRSYAENEVGHGNAKLQDAAAADALSSGGPKSAAVPVHEAMGSLSRGQNATTPQSRGPAPWYDTPLNEPHSYHAGAVNDAIKQSERRGGKVGGKERSAIHRLLRGRH